MHPPPAPGPQKLEDWKAAAVWAKPGTLLATLSSSSLPALGRAQCPAGGSRLVKR